MNYAEIQKEILLLNEKAKDGAFSKEEIQIGTFQIRNDEASLFDEPVFNFPHSTIFGMHRVLDRPIKIEQNV